MKNSCQWIGLSFLIGVLIVAAASIMMNRSIMIEREMIQREAISVGVGRYVMDTNIPPNVKFEFISPK